jgi:flagellar basal body-associated protein FliL
MALTFIFIVALLIAASIVLQKWAKDSKREEEESQEKNIYSEYEDEWMRIHRD